MSMLKFFFNHSKNSKENESVGGHPFSDPLRHPALQAMSLSQLADLPLMPENLGRPMPLREIAIPNKRCA
jgi:hypothetical protein